MSPQDDESFKAACHGVVLGVILLPLLYNIKIRKLSNILVYSALAAFELTHIVQHVKDSDVRLR